MREREGEGEGDLAVLSGVLKVKFTIAIVYWGGKRWDEERKDGRRAKRT
jgi:hypothetical protein